MRTTRWGSITKAMCLLTVLIWTCSVGTGCSVYMAAQQPGKKNLAVLKKGQLRSMVVAELGAPTESRKMGGKTVELYTFTQGYSAAAKVGRAALHGAMDVLTLGLWEVVGTPTEAYASGDDMAVEVTYDEKEQLESTTIVKGGDET